MNTFTITSNPAEKLMYRIQCAETDFDLNLLAVQIPYVCKPHSHEENELILAAGQRRCQLEQIRKGQLN